MQKLSGSFILHQGAQAFGRTNIVSELAAVVQKETFVRANLSELDEVIKVCKRKEKGPLAARTILDLEQGGIVPIYHEEDLVNIPSYVPFWPYVRQGEVCVFVNLTRYGKRNIDTGEIVIPAKIFFGVTLGANIVRMISANPTRFTNSSELVVNTGIMYSRMIRKILDKNFAISVDSVLDDKVRYVFGKYFAKTVCGIQSESLVETIAAQCVEKTGISVVQSVNEVIPESAYESMETLLQVVRVEFKRLDKLGHRHIISDMARLYGITSVVGVDYFPYLVANIVTSTLSYNVNNEFGYEAISGKEATKVTLAMARLSNS